MKTVKEMIEVMQAFEDGKQVEMVLSGMRLPSQPFVSGEKP